MKTWFSIIAIGLASTYLPVSSQGQTIWNETFTYPNGSLTNVAVSGGLWSSFSGTGNPIQVSGGQVVGMVASASSSQDSERALGSSFSTGVLFAGMDLTFSGTPTSSAYFAAFKDSPLSNFRGRLFIGAPTSSGFRIGIENDGGDAAGTTVFTSDLTLGVTYRVVLAYDVAARTSRVWVNNGVEGSPTIQDTTAATAITISTFALRQGGGTGNTYTGLNIDNLFIASDFASAYLVPEPTTLSLLGIGLLGLALRRRK